MTDNLKPTDKKVAEKIVEETKVKTVHESNIHVTPPIKQNNIITIKLDNPCHINFIIQNTAEESPRIIYDQKISLSRGTIYKLPITSESINLQNFNAIKHAPKFASILRVLNVSDGVVTIEPLIHGIVLNNGDTVAILI